MERRPENVTLLIYTNLLIPQLYPLLFHLNPQVIENEEMIESAKLKYMHTAHCLADGNIMISGMGGVKGEAKGGFALVDGKSLKVTGKYVTG